MVQQALAVVQPLSAADAWRELGISLAVNGEYAAAKVRAPGVSQHGSCWCVSETAT